MAYISKAEVLKRITDKEPITLQDIDPDKTIYKKMATNVNAHNDNLLNHTKTLEKEGEIKCVCHGPGTIDTYEVVK